MRVDWVLRLQEAFPLQMNDFDRLLEFELARMLNEVVRTPAPPRGSPVDHRSRFRLFAATEERTDVALAKPITVPSSALFP